MSEYFRKFIKKEHYPVQTYTLSLLSNNKFLKSANVKFKTNFKNTVLEALRRRTWKESDKRMIGTFIGPRRNGSMRFLTICISLPIKR